MGHDGLRLIRPDAEPFVTFHEMAERENRATLRAEAERQRAERAAREAEDLRRRLRELGRNNGLTTGVAVASGRSGFRVHFVGGREVRTLIRGRHL